MSGALNEFNGCDASGDVFAGIDSRFAADFEAFHGAVMLGVIHDPLAFRHSFKVHEIPLVGTILSLVVYRFARYARYARLCGCPCLTVAAWRVVSGR